MKGITLDESEMECCSAKFIFDESEVVCFLAKFVLVDKNIAETHSISLSSNINVAEQHSISFSSNMNESSVSLIGIYKDFVNWSCCHCLRTIKGYFPEAVKDFFRKNLTVWRRMLKLLDTTIAPKMSVVITSSHLLSTMAAKIMFFYIEKEPVETIEMIDFV